MDKKNETFDHKKTYNCHFELTLNVIGGKWKPLILYYIGVNKVIRYGDLRRAIPSINERMLTKQLRELEKDSLIVREIYKEVPPKVEYSLTEVGQSIMPILFQLQHWGISYNKRNGSPEFEIPLSNKAKK